MRVLGFKAWHDKSQTFVYFNFGGGFANDEAIKIYRELTLNGSRFYQFTGLYDRNGKEIHEGDIIRLASGRACEVIFKDGGFGYNINDHFVCFSGHKFLKIILRCEVIGNTHENPELLSK